MTPEKWDELFELLGHAVIGCLLILLLCWGLVELLNAAPPPSPAAP